MTSPAAELAAVLEAALTLPPCPRRSASFHYVHIGPLVQVRMSEKTARGLFGQLVLTHGKDDGALDGRETASDAIPISTRTYDPCTQERPPGKPAAAATSPRRRIDTLGNRA